MAIENTYLLGKNITLGCGFDLQAKAPLDSRQIVPAFAGLQALINYDAAYEGMIVYDEETKKTYQAQKCDPYTVTVGEGEDAKEKTYSIAFREFGINEAELKDLIASETTAAMEFKGAATALPENPAKGDMYKVTATFKVGEEDAKIGDSIVYDGAQWFIIPSGDDIEDTWRPVTEVDNDATLTFAAGDKLDVAVASNGTVTYSHEAIEAPELLAENEQTRTYITAVETDGFGHITGYKTATENVVDTNTTYEFEEQVEESSVYFTVTPNEENADPVTVHLDAYSKNETNTELAKKLDKDVYDAYIEGKSMSDDEMKAYAQEWISRGCQAIKEQSAADATAKANAAQSAAEAKAAELDVALKSELEGKIDDINNHSHTFDETVLNGITAGKVEAWDAAEQNAKNYADGKITDLVNNGQVKTNTEAIAAINDAENGILAQAKAYSDGLNHEDTKYTAAADGGLKLNENNEFSIDDSIIFIFDCGDSGVNA